ncbi:MAG TPA: ion transporter [Ilumatobacteraceae bacterium]|nr:ion transporter [Ilumatobacteraceae bacterium]
MTDQVYVTPGLLRWRRATDGPLLVLAIGSLPFLPLEFARHDLPRSNRVMLDVVNVAVLVGFALDYLVELALASNRRAFVRHEWTSLVIVAAQAAALLPALAAFGVLRVLRGARAFRAIAVVFRLIAIGGASAREGRDLIRRRAATFAWIAPPAIRELRELVRYRAKSVQLRAQGAGACGDGERRCAAHRGRHVRAGRSGPTRRDGGWLRATRSGLSRCEI